MIFAVSVQQDLEKGKCPEKITKSQMPLPAILFSVNNCCHIINPRKVTKSNTPPPRIKPLVKSEGFISPHTTDLTKSVMAGDGVGTLVIILGYTLYQLNSYKGGS